MSYDFFSFQISLLSASLTFGFVSSRHSKETVPRSKSTVQSAPRDSPASKGFVVLIGMGGSDPDEVVKTLVQLRKERGWSSRLFSLHSLKGSDGLYEEWCVKLSNEIRRLRIASSSSYSSPNDAVSDDCT